ncbi:MAG: pentapeptide repeat-containing protein [Okeania sp. SIO2C9]|uniref:pentapeptide repeat-containing protein n=1 Tax=Okeania sp. SIO2C9 TaxID=2607791 RepID=UPI0013C20B44|nr:pentapeptide repeat-containing protein [Okeania sp. SIO2C9]NEQ73417.1 pentapeptide repeat-containing protein [Okeania sp. SIO2C9]
MKASELLRQYQDGERNFQGVKLRGESLRGKNLSGADFSGSDIRGADFTKANLKGAKFCRVKTGLQQPQFTIYTGVVIILLVLAALSSSLRVVLGVITILSTAIISIAHGRTSTIRELLATINTVIGIGSVVSFFFTLLFCTFITGSISRVIVTTGLLPLLWVLIVGSLISIRGSRAGIVSGAIAQVKHGLIRVTLAISNELIKMTVINLSGTSFRKADLTDVDFSQATIQNTNFGYAVLHNVFWRDVRKFNQLRVGKSYLANPKIRQLIVTGKIQNQNFDYQNLRGVNLQGADLQDASFIGTNLKQANLQDADLSRAKLVQTQLDQTDLTGAILTGATIEDWGITSHTKLDGVRCRYIFMRLPTKDDPNPRRKPDNWQEEFENGDFADFIQPIVDTLDLYHNQGVDPRAIAISLKQLAENHPDAELEIVAMEKRGQDNLLLRLATALGANLSQLNAEYFQTYHEIKSLAQTEVKALLAEKDNRIYNLENMIVTALQRPSFYTQTYQSQGDIFMADTTKNDFSGGKFSQGVVNVDKSQGNRISGPIYANHVGGIINNYPPEQKQNLADAAVEIQQLLQQLEQNYPNATEIEKQSALAVTLQQEIKQNPTLKARLINALKEGGIEALKVLFGPIGIPIEMVKGWIEAEAS